MEFENQIQKLSDRIEKNKSSVTTEEATKTSFILPLLNILGFDIFDPNVVIPEFTADIGKKKGEKVDYAIVVDDKPIILIEAKSHTENLDRHKTQLERYFTVTDSKFGILTNGVEYLFYSDLSKPNIMDTKPFLVIDMLNLKNRDIKELEKFKAENFNIENILNMAGVQKYVSAIKDIFKNEVKNPSDEFVKLFASQIVSKPLRQNIIDEFRVYIKQSFSEVITDLVSEKINSLNDKLTQEDEVNQDNIEIKQNDNGIVTTEEELEGYFIVKSILAEIVELKRIAQRDTKSYFGILLDDNNRKWIARLHFNYSTKYLEVRVDDKSGKKFQLEKIEDIYNYKKELLQSAELLLQ
jgi:hypothetical protein